MLLLNKMCPELDNCREKTKIISHKEDQLMDTRVSEGILPKSLTPITFFKDFIMLPTPSIERKCRKSCLLMVYQRSHQKATQKYKLDGPNS